jgi:hypothetical protein
VDNLPAGGAEEAGPFASRCRDRETQQGKYPLCGRGGMQFRSAASLTRELAEFVRQKLALPDGRRRLGPPDFA